MTVMDRVLISFGIIIVLSCIRHFVYWLCADGGQSTEESDFHFRLVIAVILLGWVISG